MIWSSIQTVADGLVDVAWTSLSETDERPYMNLLAADEQARSLRFAKENDRRAFVVGRIAVRLLISERIGVSPAGIRFEYSDHGRPVVGQAPDFNISHSGDHVVVAIARPPNTTIGVDVECHARQTATDALESLVFVSEEISWLDACCDRREGFFRLWVRKEAMLKAAGTGLTIDPRLLSIDPLTCQVCWATTAPPGRCRIYDIQSPRGVSAAVAVLCR